MVHQQNAAGRKTHRARWIVLGVVVVLAVVAGAFSHFGGFGTGPSADPDELAAYAQGVDDITVPDGVKVVALGEATHGNSEFQQLKLDVFKMLVEKYDVRAFALEGDFGGCEVVNRYIHGESDTSQGAVASIGYDEATAAIGFTIYRTDEMANLVAWMRAYNETAAPGEDLRFYGFDMQRGARNMAYLIEACQNHGVDTASLYLLANGEDWSDAYAWDERIAIISAIRQELADAGASAHELHFADVLLQHCTYYQAMETESSGDSSLRRDAMMADNIQWISEQEQALGLRVRPRRACGEDKLRINGQSPFTRLRGRLLRHRHGLLPHDVQYAFHGQPLRFRFLFLRPAGKGREDCRTRCLLVGLLKGPRGFGARKGLFILHVHGQPGRGLFAAHARAADDISGVPMSLDLVRQSHPGFRGNPH